MDNIIFTRSDCSFCDEAKKLLKERGIKLEERNTDGADGWMQMVQYIHKFYDQYARTVPQIIIDGEYVGGYKELHARLHQ